MHRFRVARSEAAFEQVWLSRQPPRQAAGLWRVSPSRRPEAEDHTLYACHTVRENRAVLEDGPDPRRFGQRIVAQEITSPRDEGLAGGSLYFLSFRGRSVGFTFLS